MVLLTSHVLEGGSWSCIRTMCRSDENFFQTAKGTIKACEVYPDVLVSTVRCMTRCMLFYPRAFVTFIHNDQLLEIVSLVRDSNITNWEETQRNLGQVGGCTTHCYEAKSRNATCALLGDPVTNTLGLFILAGSGLHSACMYVYWTDCVPADAAHLPD